MPPSTLSNNKKPNKEFSANKSSSTPNTSEKNANTMSTDRLKNAKEEAERAIKVIN